MVNINQYTGTGTNTPLLNQSPIDQSSILNSGNSVAQAYARNMGQDLQAAESTRLQATRANLIAKEAEHQQNLNMAESYIKTNQILLQGINSVAAIDEAKRKEEEDTVAKTFLLNTTNQMTTDYMKFLDQANSTMNPDGSGYHTTIQDYLNNQIEQYTNAAPNEKAKLEFYTKASEFKVKAIQNALNVESDARKNYRIGLVETSANNVINQTYLNPNNADGYMSSLDGIKTVLKQNGFNEAQSSEFIKAKTEDLRTAQIKGLLNKGEGLQAESLLSTDAFTSTLAPNRFDSLQREVLTNNRDQLIAQQKQANLAQASEAFAKGFLPKGSPDFNKAADFNANEVLFNQLPARPAFSVNDVSTTAGLISSYFTTHNSGIGEQTGNKLSGVINVSDNPFEVVGYALGLNSLVKSTDRNTNKVIDGLDKETVTLAGRISTLVNTGTPSQTAVALARKELADSKVPGGDIWIKDQLAKESLDRIGLSNFMDKALDSITTWFPTDQAATYESQVRDMYIGNLYQYKNADLAKEATVTQIKKQYAVSKINGATQVLEAAPEMFYDGDVMSIFKDKSVISKSEVGNTLGWTDNKDGTFNTPSGLVKPELRSIPNVTLNQPQYAKSYLWYDSLTGLPISDNKGNLAQFNFSLDNTEYGNNLKQAAVDYQSQRKLYNDLFDNRINNYNRDILTVKAKQLAYSSHNKLRELIGLDTITEPTLPGEGK